MNEMLFRNKTFSVIANSLVFISVKNQKLSDDTNKTSLRA